jgi:hypothetical protein
MSVMVPVSSTAKARTPVVPASIATTVPIGPTLEEDDPPRPRAIRTEASHLGRREPTVVDSGVTTVL